MHWQRGFRRLRIVGTVAVALGAVLLLSIILSQALGYAPDPSFQQVFSAFWPLGLVFLVVGGLLWIGVWIGSGFLHPEAVDDETLRRR